MTCQHKKLLVIGYRLLAGFGFQVTRYRFQAPGYRSFFMGEDMTRLVIRSQVMGDRSHDTIYKFQLTY